MNKKMVYFFLFLKKFLDFNTHNGCVLDLLKSGSRWKNFRKKSNRVSLIRLWSNYLFQYKNKVEMNSFILDDVNNL